MDPSREKCLESQAELAAAHEPLWVLSRASSVHASQPGNHSSWGTLEFLQGARGSTVHMGTKHHTLLRCTTVLAKHTQDTV